MKIIIILSFILAFNAFSEMEIPSKKQKNPGKPDSISTPTPIPSPSPTPTPTPTPTSTPNDLN